MIKYNKIRYDKIYLKVSGFKLAESVINLEFDIIWQVQPMSCWQVLEEKKNLREISTSGLKILCHFTFFMGTWSNFAGLGDNTVETSRRGLLMLFSL